MTHKIGNVLLIEDEEIDQKLYSRVLMRSGIVANVTAFTYADEALDFLEANDDHEIDVIFLDINIPRMDGFQFLEKATRELNRKIADVVIIMLTTSLDPRDRERVTKFDAVRAFINKPLQLADIEHAARLLAEVRAKRP